MSKTRWHGSTEDLRRRREKPHFRCENCAAFRRVDSPDMRGEEGIPVCALAARALILPADAACRMYRPGDGLRGGLRDADGADEV